MATAAEFVTGRNTVDLVVRSLVRAKIDASWITWASIVWTWETRYPRFARRVAAAYEVDGTLTDEFRVEYVDRVSELVHAIQDWQAMKAAAVATRAHVLTLMSSTEAYLITGDDEFADGVF